MLTKSGNPEKKLEYVFKLYDADSSGYLDKKEVKQILIGMIDLLSIFIT